MSPLVKNVILIVVLVGALIGAGFFFTRTPKDRTYPEDGPISTWMCEKCLKQYELSPAKYNAWLNSQDRVRRDPKYSAKLVVFWCDDCQKFSIVSAMKHPSGKWYMRNDSEGNQLPTPDWVIEYDKEMHEKMSAGSGGG